MMHLPSVIQRDTKAGRLQVLHGFSTEVHRYFFSRLKKYSFIQIVFQVVSHLARVCEYRGWASPRSCTGTDKCGSSQRNVKILRLSPSSGNKFDPHHLFCEKGFFHKRETLISYRLLPLYPSSSSWKH